MGSDFYQAHDLQYCFSFRKTNIMEIERNGNNSENASHVFIAI